MTRLRYGTAGVAALATLAHLAARANVARIRANPDAHTADDLVREPAGSEVWITRPDGACLRALVAGAGHLCLVLHGGPGLDHTYLHPWLAPLGDRLQLVFYDQRGNGRSTTRLGETPDFGQLCADADAIRAAIGAERVALLGHSFGGFVALEYALRYPERVSHLILVDTAPSFDYGEEIQANILCKDPSEAVLAAISAPPPALDAEFAALWRCDGQPHCPLRGRRAHRRDARARPWHLAGAVAGLRALGWQGGAETAHTKWN